MSFFGTGTFGTGAYGSTAAVTAAADTSWPPRVTVSGTGFNPGESVTLYRVRSSVRTLVRGAQDVLLADVALVRTDAEEPFSAAFTYVVSVNAGPEVSSAPLTVTLAGGKVVLSDAVGGGSAEVVISAWPEKAQTRAASRFVVGGRTVIVSAPRGGIDATIELFTETEAARSNLVSLLTTATSGIVLLRQPGGYTGVDGTYAVLGDTERRYSQDGSDPRRTFALDVAECDGWASNIPALGWTLGDIYTVYSALTLFNLGADYPTLLAVATANWG